MNEYDEYTAKSQEDSKQALYEKGRSAKRFTQIVQALMIYALSLIAERKINQAIKDGELEVEGWHGKPLPSEDNSHIPPDLRMAYKLLKNSGYLPPEIEAKKEIQKLEELIASTEDEHARVKQLKKLNFLTLKLSTMRQRPIHLEQGEYHRKVVEKISVASKVDD